MADSGNKMKMLKILEYLRTSSSADKPATTKDLIQYLNSIGISCERRTMYKDMELLLENCDNVFKVEFSRENAYYIEDNSLSIAELKILIDAVEAANFITEDKSQDLKAKLLSMAGTRKNEIVRENIIFYNNHKHTNEGIFDNIEQIETAIQQEKQITFFYFDLDENANRVYRKEKKRYSTDPIALVFSEDNYYLVSYSQKYEGNTNYRVDRMEAVEIVETPICEEAKIRKQSTEDYTEQVFKMYNGETVRIQLEFPFELLGAIYDKFGEQLPVSKTEDKYRAFITVQDSPPFRGWLHQFGDRVKIIDTENE